MNGTRKPRMTARDRFDATFRYGSPDRVYLLQQWMFDDTLRRWRREGMPADVHFTDYFGFDRQGWIELKHGPIPPVESRVVETGSEWEIVEDDFGARTKRWTNREIGMSQWLTPPVRDRASWEAWKARHNPDSPSRYPEYWDDLKRTFRGRDYPLGIFIGSPYGIPRNLLGMENLAYLCYDDPGFVEELVTYNAWFFERLVERALDEVPDIDFAAVWEDMAMKTGPLISPAHYRRFMMGPLAKSTKRAREAGIDIVTLDCDGNLDAMIPLWLEAGVNSVYPLEVAAGCDAVRYREAHGEQLRMFGNIDKRALRDGCTREDIEREVARLVPLIRAGGFAPMVDHAVPPDVPLGNFRYYLSLVNDLYSGA